MSLSKVIKYYCLESSTFFADDILNIKEGVNDLSRGRPKYGEFHTIYEEIRNEPDRFFTYTKMSVDTFDYILNSIRPYLKSSVNRLRSISPTEQLFLTLRFLSTGFTFKSLRNAYRLGKSTIGKCIYQTCEAIRIALSMDHMPQLTKEQLVNLTDNFFLNWQFPNCVGAIGRKYFRIKKPRKDGKDFTTKQKYSLVLQSVVGYDFKFITTEVGVKVRQSDGETFACSKLYKSIASGRFKMPPPRNLPGSNIILPYVLVGDEAYPLKTFLMRPYPSTKLNDGDDKKIFNERISKAQVPTQITYRILSKKWKIFHKPMETNMVHARLLIRVACLLHNIIRDKDGHRDPDYCTVNETRNDVSKLVRSRRNNRAAFQAIQIRDQFKVYFNEN